MTKHFSRRNIISGIPAAGVAVLAAPGVHASAPRYHWRMVTSWAKGTPGPGTTADRLAERITAMSDGQLTVQVYGAGELVSPFGVFDAVSGDTAEMGHTASFFWQGKAPAAAYFTTVPFGMTPTGHNAWIRYGGGQALWDALYAPYNLAAYMAGNSGMTMGGWMKAPLGSLEDIKGRKLRVAGLGGKVLQALGASPVTLPPSEILPALKSGAIDGVEFLGPFSDMALGFHKAAKYYYWPGFNKPNGTAECLLNKKALDALPSHLRAIIQSACDAENDQGLAEAQQYNAAALTKLQAMDGITIQAFPDDIIAAARDVAADVLSDVANTSDLAARIHRSFSAARRQALHWATVSDAAFYKSFI